MHFSKISIEDVEDRNSSSMIDEPKTIIITDAVSKKSKVLIF